MVLKKSYLTYINIYTLKYLKITKKYNFNNNNDYKNFSKILLMCFMQFRACL